MVFVFYDFRFFSVEVSFIDLVELGMVLLCMLVFL